MKKKIVLVLILILSFILADRVFTYFLFECNHIFFSDHDFENRLRRNLSPNHYNALIMGSSRTYEGIHPSILKTKKLVPFKWSFAGFGPRYNYFFYKLYKKINGKPDVIIYGIDYFIYTLFSSPSAMAELKDQDSGRFKVDYLEPVPLLIKHKKKIDIIVSDILRNIRGRNNPLFRDIEKMQQYTGAVKAELFSHNVNSERVKSLKGVAFTKPPGSEGEYFIKMLDELKNDEVKIILVVIPEHIGTFRTNRFQMIFRMHLKKLKKEYSNLDVININYIKKFDLGDESLFLDGGYGFSNSHLSRKGALEFNRILGAELRKLGY